METKKVEEVIVIPMWKFKTIENALRLTHNIHKSKNEETAFDREVVRAYNHAKDALKNNVTTSQQQTIERLTKWNKTEEKQPNIEDDCLVYHDEWGFIIDKWIEHYEEPYPGGGRILTGEGWEEVEIMESYWLPLPTKPEQLLNTIEPIESEQDFWCGERSAGKEQCDNQCPSCADDV